MGTGHLCNRDQPAARKGATQSVGSQYSREDVTRLPRGGGLISVRAGVSSSLSRGFRNDHFLCRALHPEKARSTARWRRGSDWAPPRRCSATAGHCRSHSSSAIVHGCFDGFAGGQRCRCPPGSWRDRHSTVRYRAVPLHAGLVSEFQSMLAHLLIPVAIAVGLA